MLEGKAIVITGGSSGIGLALAEAVRDAGAASVVLMARNPERLDAAATRVGPRARGVVVDVTDEKAVREAFASVGAFDHLVTAAAGTDRGAIVDTDYARAKALFESKFWGQHHCLKHGAPLLRAAGSVTLMSGWISRKPMRETGTLAAVDGAIESLTRVAALELAPIRVNAVTPGQIDTPLWRARLDAPGRSEYFASLGTKLPVGRAGRPEDVAHAILFSMTNGFTTGAVIDVDGGQSAW